MTTRSKIKDAAIYFAAKDMRSFSTVQGEGFVHFCQTLVDATAKLGHSFDVKTVLPSKATKSSGVRISADKLRRTTLQQISGVISDIGSAFTTDLWEESCRKIDYISLTIHYIDRDFNLIARVLEMKEFTEKKTGLNIRAMIDSVFHSYGFNGSYGKFNFCDRSRLKHD